MRCRDAKVWLTAQRDNDLTQSEITALQEHLRTCSACRTDVEKKERQKGTLDYQEWTT